MRESGPSDAEHQRSVSQEKAYIGGLAIADLLRAKSARRMMPIPGRHSEFLISARPGYYCIFLKEDKSIHFQAGVHESPNGERFASFNYATRLKDGAKHPDLFAKELVRWTMHDFQADFGELDGVNFVWQSKSQSNFQAYDATKKILYKQFLQAGLPPLIALDRAQREAATTATYDGQLFTSSQFGFTLAFVDEKPLPLGGYEVSGRFTRAKPNEQPIAS